MIDVDAKYIKSHEWIKKAEADVYVVGMSDYAVQQLGDVVYLELPAVGSEFAREQAFGVVESVKSAFDICMPVSGKVVEVNESVPEDLDVLKKDPFGNGWLIKIEVTDDSEFEGLMDSAAYEVYLKTEAQEH